MHDSQTWTIVWLPEGVGAAQYTGHRGKNVGYYNSINNKIQLKKLISSQQKQNSRGLHGELNIYIFVCLFIYFNVILFIYFQREGREGKERERNINVWLPLTYSPLGTWPTTQACSLTGNQTCNSLIHRPVLNPLSHTSQGTIRVYMYIYYFILFYFILFLWLLYYSCTNFPLLLSPVPSTPPLPQSILNLFSLSMGCLYLSFNQTIPLLSSIIPLHLHLWSLPVCSCFHASVYIWLISLFCSLCSCYKLGHMAFLFSHLAYFT